MLTLVLVNAFNLDIKEGIDINFDVAVLTQIVRQALFVCLFNGPPPLTELFVVDELF